MTKAEARDCWPQEEGSCSICNYRIASVLWVQMRGWELCPVKHLSQLSLRRKADSSGWLPPGRDGVSICQPDMLFRDVFCLPVAQIWDVVDRLLRPVQPLGYSPLPREHQWYSQGNPERIKYGYMVSQVVVEDMWPRWFSPLGGRAREGVDRPCRSATTCTAGVNNKDLSFMTMGSSFAIKGGYKETGSAWPSGAKTS